MALPHPVPSELAEVIAQRFRVLGDPTRIRLLDQLRSGEASVQELTLALGNTTQQNISKHLGVLHQADMLARRKEGNFVRYAIADEGVLELCEHVCGGLARQADELAALVQEARA